MESDFLQQFKILNNLILKYNNLSISNFNEISDQINNLNISINKINSDFFSYQSNITNQPWFSFVIGSAITIIATLLLNYLNNRNQKKDNLYYLERILTDQINLIVDIKRTINDFIPRIDNLINAINSNPDTAYSADNVFFPLFSSRSLPDEINKIKSGSGYIDNKINRDYHMSKDLPHMINDLRLQLEKTIEKNDKIAFEKLNPPKEQKDQFRRNITEYKLLINRDILGKNIPLYLTTLSETIVAVRELRKIGIIRWKLRFDPKYNFFVNKNKYLENINLLHDNMDKFFKKDTEILLEKIENM